MNSGYVHWSIYFPFTRLFTWPPMFKQNVSQCRFDYIFMISMCVQLCEITHDLIHTSLAVKTQSWVQYVDFVSIHVSRISISFYIPLCISISSTHLLYTSLYIYQSIINLYLYLSTYLSTYLHIIYLSIYLPTYLSIYHLLICCPLSLSHSCSSWFQGGIFIDELMIRRISTERE